MSKRVPAWQVVERSMFFHWIKGGCGPDSLTDTALCDPTYQVPDELMTKHNGNEPTCPRCREIGIHRRGPPIYP